MTRIDLYLGLSDRAMAVDGRVVMFEPALSPAQALDGLFQRAVKEASRRWPRPSARVWLSGALARPFVFGPLEGLKRWNEVLALARARAADATGMTEDCEVTVEDWPAPQSTLAVAVASSVLIALESAAQQQGVRLTSIRPWWAVAAERLLAAQQGRGITAVSDTDSLVALTWQDGRVQGATAYLPGPAPEESDALLARVALTCDVMHEHVHRISFDGSGKCGSVDLPFSGPSEGARG